MDWKSRRLLELAGIKRRRTPDHLLREGDEGEEDPFADEGEDDPFGDEGAEDDAGDGGGDVWLSSGDDSGDGGGDDNGDSPQPGMPTDTVLITFH